MKVKVNKNFLDLKENIARKKGDTFICSKKRFEEIEAKLPNFITEIKTKKIKGE